MNEDTADAAIGNITGSNSVNVFLGLGIPWVIATLYKHYNYVEDVRIFTIVVVFQGFFEKLSQYFNHSNFY